MILENVAYVARKAIVDRLDWLEMMVPEESLDPSVQLVHQVPRVMQDFQDCLVYEVPSVPPDHLVTWECPDQLVKLDRKEKQEVKGLLDPVELKANRDKRDPQVYLVTRDHVVTQVLEPNQAELVHPDHQGHLEFPV